MDTPEKPSAEFVTTGILARMVEHALMGGELGIDTLGEVAFVGVQTTRVIGIPRQNSA